MSITGAAYGSPQVKAKIMTQEETEKLKAAFMAGVDAGIDFASDKIRGYSINKEDEEEAFEAFLITL